MSAVTFQTLGYFAEALIFSYVGLGIFKQSKEDWSMSFIGIELALIVFARITSVLTVQFTFCLFGAESTLKWKECVFLSYAGMIRGAIALGLAIKAEKYFSQYGFVIASVLALVLLSTLLFGSFMPLVAKLLLDPPKTKHVAAPAYHIENMDPAQSNSELS